MTLHDTTRIDVAADRLLEMADRVLGASADRADRYAYVSVLLSQWGEELELRLRTDLRVACYERLFEIGDGDDAASLPH